MPIPPNSRNAITPGRLGSNAQPRADAIKRIAVKICGFFLPNLSLSSPESATPIMQPNKAEDTNHPS
ncbi:hypothetical protein D3C72_2026890 [compost metagenome]